MVETNAAHKLVSLSPTISEGEVNYVMQRKRRIQKWLNSQGITCELEEVPSIALLGSGGGERAAVGLLGSLLQLGQEDMLDCLLYMCGVSGSTWCMSSLYKDPEWSESYDRVQEVIRSLEGPSVGFKEAVRWLRARQQQDPDFSLTDVWGALVTSRFLKEMDHRVLSAEVHRDSTNPYPIYTAIKYNSSKDGNTEGEWFEMTPHESGYSGLDAFVATSHLRSNFEGGVLIKKRPEMDMILLQGICGSALADGQRNVLEITKKIWGFLRGYKDEKVVTTNRALAFGVKENDSERMMMMAAEPVVVVECGCVPARVMSGVFELMEYGEDPKAQLEDRKILNSIDTLGQLLEGQLNSAGEKLWNMDVDTWQRSSLEERRAFIDAVSMELVLGPDTWAQSWKDQSCSCYGGRSKSRTKSLFPRPRFDAWWVAMNIFPLVREWKWGTTSNFLYQCKDCNLPSSLVEEKKVRLIDAALDINSPYPPVLRPGREVDLIISLDFSAGDPFETLFRAKEYAKERSLPFPKVEKSVRENKDRPEDLYVFSGRRANEPTVVHMPLFNLQNCRGADGIRQLRERYSTFQKSYSQEQMQELLDRARDNVRNGRQRILEQIKAAVLRKQARRSPPTPIPRPMRFYPGHEERDPAPWGPSRVAPPEQALWGPGRVAQPEQAPQGPGVVAPPEQAPQGPRRVAQPEQFPQCPGRVAPPEQALWGPGRVAPPEQAPQGPGRVAPPEQALWGPGRVAPPEQAPQGPGRVAPPEQAPQGPGRVAPPEQALWGPGRVAPPEQAPQGYYLMPIGPNYFPTGPSCMPCWPQVAPGPGGWPWGGQQNPAQMRMAPPLAAAPGPLPAMPFPGYYMMPMACPPWPFPAHSAP